MYTVKITTKGQAEGLIYKMQRNKENELTQDICSLVNDHIMDILDLGRLVGAYVKLKDGSWRLICDLKLASN